MGRHFGIAVVAGAWMAWAAAACSAQSTPATGPAPTPAANPAPCSVTPQPVPCGTAPAASGKTNAAETFPFPEEGSGGGVPLTPGTAAPNLSGLPQTPDASGAASAGKTAAQFPFPEDVTGAGNGSPGASGAGASGASESGASDSSSSSSSSSSSNSGNDAATDDPDAKTTDPDAKAAGSPDAAGLTDKGSEGTTGRHLLHRVNPVGTKLQTPEEREAEDLSVAKFYTDTGDLQGAYLRSQDAVKTAPDDPDAHFALAAAAQRMNKRDEAIAEYKACLKLDPADKEAKEARKALERLNP